MPDNFQITQGSGTFLATDQAGSGEHYQRVKLVESTPDSTTPTGVTSNPLKVDGSGTTQPVSGTVAVSNFPTGITPVDLVVSVTSATGAALSATLPAVSSKFHYITRIEVVYYAIANIAGAPTPITVNSTNLPGSLTWIIDTLATKGAALFRSLSFSNPIKSSLVNTDTVISCPATANVIWQINVYYYVV